MKIRIVTYNVYSFRGWPKEVGVTFEKIIPSFVRARYLSECRVLSEPPFRVDPQAKKLWSLSDHLPVMATFK
ncbi:hypothetical protein J7K28_06545 [Candidatus Aerophobetes bacterium]|nr:hypothetical protein [Candidatus Aerophobetes bacterium]